LELNHVSNILNIDDLKRNREEKLLNQSLDEKTIKIVNLLFQELQSIFPAFKQAWPTEECFQRAKRNWVKAFMVSGINNIAQLKFGIRKCILSESPFVPTSGQFISWCTPQPEDLGLPTVEEAFTQSIRMTSEFYEPLYNDSELVIKHSLDQIETGVGIGNYKFMMHNKGKKLFEYYYKVSIKQFIDGNLHMIQKAISEKPEEHPIDEEKSRKIREQTMIEIKKIISRNRKI
jgi:hypothetical protein